MTEADLVCPGLCLKGNFSITTDEIFFEVNEKHESVQKADVGVSVAFVVFNVCCDVTENKTKVRTAEFS